MRRTARGITHRFDTDNFVRRNIQTWQGCFKRCRRALVALEERLGNVRLQITVREGGGMLELRLDDPRTASDLRAAGFTGLPPFYAVTVGTKKPAKVLVERLCVRLGIPLSHLNLALDGLKKDRTWTKERLPMTAQRPKRQGRRNKMRHGARNALSL